MKVLVSYCSITKIMGGHDQACFVMAKSMLHSHGHESINVPAHRSARLPVKWTGQGTSRLTALCVNKKRGMITGQGQGESGYKISLNCMKRTLV